MNTTICRVGQGSHGLVPECNEPAVWMVWGCCEYYEYPLCDGHTQVAMNEDWGAATDSCEPTECEWLEDYIKRIGSPSNGK